MLGERRSKAAFSAGFPEAVREETRQDSGHLPEEIMETEASLDGLDGGELLCLYEARSEQFHELV